MVELDFTKLNSIGKDANKEESVEELMRIRGEIDRRIKELQNQVVDCGEAKYMVKKYPSGDVLHSISFVRKCEGANPMWKSIVEEPDKAHAIGRLKKLLQDAQGLLEKLEG